MSSAGRHFPTWRITRGNIVAPDERMLGFSPKFGAVLHTIPTPVLGNLATVVFGLIGAAMIRL